MRHVGDLSRSLRHSGPCFIYRLVDHARQTLRRERTPKSLVQGSGNAKHKGWNFLLETLAILGDKEVTACHRGSWGVNLGAARVFKALPRRDQRLLTDHAKPLDLINLTVVRRNDPVPANQLCSDRSCVGDGDGVGESVALLLRRGLLGKINRFHGNLELVARFSVFSHRGIQVF